ncbi:hypothetical protein [Nannocystis pusilla]
MIAHLIDQAPENALVDPGELNFGERALEYGQEVEERRRDGIGVVAVVHG